MERIQLSNRSFEGNNNAYLFADGPETVLVDTGDRVPDTRTQLERALADHGTSFADIDRIFLTHWHGDHRGLAGPIQQESSATVHVHEADADLVAGDQTAWEALEERQETYFRKWQMPTAKREVLREILDSVAWREDAPDVTPMADGDSFTVNGQRLDVVHAPGHSAGLCLFETTIDGKREVLTGDALLPQYTPNVGGADIRVERPLAKYLQTLEHIAAADYHRAWPGHRDEISNPTERAEYIAYHHRERAYRVLDALRRNGPSTVWEVSDDLFGDLEHIHILHGPGESYAHLEHLEHEGSVVQEDGQYRLADGVAERLDARAEADWPIDTAY